MVTNSTFLYVLNDPGNEDEVTELNDLFKFVEYCDGELEEILGVFDYSPSQEAIKKILDYALKGQ